MTVVSDTNILSSLAVAHSLVLLQRLFRRSTISIPPAVRDELQVAVDRGRTYLAPLVAAITAGEIATLELTEDERALLSALPRKLNALDVTDWGGAIFAWGGPESQPGMTIWSPFAQDTDYMQPSSASLYDQLPRGGSGRTARDVAR